MSTNHVNLLDSDSREFGRTELDYLSILIALVILTVGCLGYVGWQKYKLRSFTKQIEQLTAEMNQGSNSSSFEQKRTANSEALIKKVQPISWSLLLKKISHITPSSIYISQLTGSIGEKRQLILTGNSHKLSSIFAFKENLSKLPDCEKTSIVNLNRTTFQIECLIK